MKHYQTEKYRIEIYDDHTFIEGSTDNFTQYDLIYFDEAEYIFPSVFGIKVFEENSLLKSAVIGSIGGGKSIHETSTILESDRLLVCCSDTIFCLSIPDLNLLWRTQADQATCFEIYKYQDSYIIHGEIEISRLDKNGKILWQQSGADIFTTIKGTGDFELTHNRIIATDWQNGKYFFDYDGILISYLE